MKRIRDIEEAYDLLKEVRDIFKNLRLSSCEVGGDSVVSLEKIKICVKKIDKLIKKEEE